MYDVNWLTYVSPLSPYDSHMETNLQTQPIWNSLGVS